ncbi:MAG: hypothetical protein HC844_07995 [Tabrizicola sp.]|nr:hypothetical protein [Tabrizicola sp.]
MVGRALSDAEWDGLVRREPSPWFHAVLTTGIVCRAGCPARPHRQNTRRFDRLDEALAAGFRSCKRCKPG